MQFFVQTQDKRSQFHAVPRIPTIRLPREFNALVGETARIYLCEDKNQLAFKVIIDKKVDNFCTNSEKSELEDR